MQGDGIVGAFGVIVHEVSPSQSIRRAATSGDRARRVSAAVRLIERTGPFAASVACVSAIASILLGGPGLVGVILLGIAALVAGLVVLAARRERPVPDEVVAALDRAADLGGALRSAHWFVQTAGSPVPPNADWTAFHIGTAASRSDHVNWTTVYARPSARRRWLAAFALTAATLGLVLWQSPPVLRSSTHSAQPPRTTANGLPIPSSLVPELVEGMQAINSGRVPSHEALAAVGQALEIAKRDPAAQKQMEALLAKASSNATDSDFSQDPWNDVVPGSREEYEMLAALEWAYKDTVARAPIDDQIRRDAARAAPAAKRSEDGKPGDRKPDDVGSGATADAPVLADTRGQPASFSTLLFGRQQASADSGKPASQPASARAATIAAALRSEVIQARSDAGDLDRETAAARRATNGGRAPGTAVVMENGVNYDRSRARQPPAVPEPRRSLVHHFFLRPAR